MGNTQELRFQGLCLVNSEGYRWMHCYDYLPEVVRDRLKSSNYNLCAACVSRAAQDRYGKYGRTPTVPEYLKTIEAMEQQLKCEEVAA